MKKTMALVLMALMMLSIVPYALADDNETKVRLGIGVNADTEEDSDDDSAGASADAEANANLDIRAKNNRNRGDDRKDNYSDEVAREDSEGRKLKLNMSGIIRARENLKVARMHFNETKDDFIESRKELKEHQETERKECRSDNESDACASVKVKVANDSQEFLIASANHILSMLDQLKEKIMSSDNIDVETQASIVADIDASVAKVAAAKVHAEALTENSTKEEVKAVAKELREAWVDSRAHATIGLGRLTTAKIEHVIGRFNSVEEKLTVTIADLNARGYDTTTVQANVDSMSASVDSAEVNLNAAESIYANASATEDPSELVKEANKYVKAAQQDLREAHEFLKDALKELRKRQVSAGLNATIGGEADVQ